ncbi:MULTISPECIES: hypothetical protein [unclassified Maridesulfovibrio]|uniref:hypothetical protein n=1 Tax=unclassified Maridesulfovibrio TaxID=2794999 RepID=UPI003B425B04
MLYLKIFKKDFMCFDESFGSIIQARLIPVNFRIFRWNKWTLEEEKNWDPKDQVPEGWEPALDFDINLQGRTYRLTIHSETAWRDLVPYMENLRRNGRRITDVITQMTIASRRKVKPSVRFEMVGDV